MPKRVIDADAMWKSEKLGKCLPKSIPEYAWLYGLADANGNFELTNLRAVHSHAYAPIRPLFSLQDLREVIDDFARHGLLFIWEEKGKRFGHWTGSDKPGRLPSRTQRRYYTNVDVRTPEKEENWKTLQEYLASVEAAEDISAELFPRKAFPTAAAIEEEAETIVDHAQRNGDDPAAKKAFGVFWKLYPNKRDEHGAWLKFKRIQPTDWSTVISSIEAWEACPLWKNPQYIPKAVKFLTQEDWRVQPPKEANGKPDPNTRTERNLRNAGLAHSKVDRHSG
jgi:hypothetical protein